MVELEIICEKRTVLLQITFVVGVKHLGVKRRERVEELFLLSVVRSTCVSSREDEEN